MNSSLQSTMKLAVLLVVGFLSLVTVAIPVPASTSSIAVAAGSAGQDETGLSYAQSFASTSTASLSNSGPLSSAQDSALTRNLQSGNAAISSSDALATVENSDCNTAHQNLNSNSELNANANENTDYSDNRFPLNNSHQAVQESADAAASKGENQNQGSNENHGTENLSGRILHYAQSGPVIHIVTTGSENKVDVSGNNQGSGSTNAANAVANLDQAGNQFHQGLGISGSPSNGQILHSTNPGASALAGAIVASTSANIAANGDSLVNAGVSSGARPGGSSIPVNNGIGALYQTSYNNNSTSSSSSSSSHSESQNSSSSNSSNSSYNFGTLF